MRRPFRLRRSDLLGEPDGVYVNGDVVTLLYGSPDRVRLLVTEIGDSAALSPEVAKKIVAADDQHGVRADHRLGRSPASGSRAGLTCSTCRAHPRGWPRTRSSGRATTSPLRIEGAATLDTAVRIAESLRVNGTRRGRAVYRVTMSTQEVAR